MKKILFISFVVVAGCAGNQIDQLGPDTFIITKNSMAFGARESDARSNAIRAATQYCEADSKIFQVVSIQTRPAYPFNPPEATIQFMCLKPGDPDLKRPRLRKEADTVIEVR